MTDSEVCADMKVFLSHLALETKLDNDPNHEDVTITYNTKENSVDSKPVPIEYKYESFDTQGLFSKKSVKNQEVLKFYHLLNFAKFQITSEMYIDVPKYYAIVVDTRYVRGANHHTVGMVYIKKSHFHLSKLLYCMHQLELNEWHSSVAVQRSLHDSMIFYRKTLQQKDKKHCLEQIIEDVYTNYDFLTSISDKLYDGHGGRGSIYHMFTEFYKAHVTPKYNPVDASNHEECKKILREEVEGALNGAFTDFDYLKIKGICKNYQQEESSLRELPLEMIGAIFEFISFSDDTPLA